VQIDVFVRWMRGASERAIAIDLDLSTETVRSHLKDIRAAAGISGQVDLANAVQKLGPG